MLGTMRPGGWILLRRRLYVVLLLAGLAGLGALIVDSPQPAHMAAATTAAPTGLKALTDGAAMDGFGSWSPDGKQIAFMRDGRIWVMAADASAPRPVTKTDGFWDAVPAWRPDGKQIAFVRLSLTGGANQVMTVDPASGTERTIASEDGPVGHVTWAPSGSELYYATQRKVMRAALAGGAPKTVVATEEDWELLAGGMTISHDGQRLYFGAGPRMGRDVRYDLWMAQLDGKAGEPQRLTTDGGIMPALDGQDARLVYRNPYRASGIYLLELPLRQPPAPKLIMSDEQRAMYFHPSFSPDGRQLLISRLLMDDAGGSGQPGKFTSHLYVHTLAGSGRD